MWTCESTSSTDGVLLRTGAIALKTPQCLFELGEPVRAPGAQAVGIGARIVGVPITLAIGQRALQRCEIGARRGAL